MGSDGDTPVYRGSRKHVLDWTAQPGFLEELAALISTVPLSFDERTIWMPRGPTAPAEARLERFGPDWLPGHPAWAELQRWWLAATRGANTPNWDIAVGCTIEGIPGLVLVEAKANEPEMSEAGKAIRSDASTASRANHERIGEAIDEARVGLKHHHPDVRIRRDSHYQLANRVAFTWKLGELGIPTALVYLGFTHDPGIADAGAPFANASDWDRAFAAYVDGTVPLELFERRLTTSAAPIWLLSRSRRAMEASPARPRP